MREFSNLSLAHIKYLAYQVEVENNSNDLRDAYAPPHKERVFHTNYTLEEDRRINRLMRCGDNNKN